MLLALKLTKLPEHRITAIKNLTESWYTRLHLQSTQESIISDLIKIKTGIYQGDSLSVILFVLSLNPLSHMLKSTGGYTFGKERKHQHTHNFFVDDLKLYSTTMKSLKEQLNIVTTFSKDIGMKFGADKCAVLHIHKGKIVKEQEPISINGLTITPLCEGDSYKYLGIDENISYDGPLNKERITKEYITRVKKIWSSELSEYNKSTAHNTFAVPVITPTVGIIDWTIEDIKNLDIKTRKILTMTGNFHPNSDVDKLYITRSKGGRGLKSIKNLFECRIVSVYQHLKLNHQKSEILEHVFNSEKEMLVRLSQGLLRNYDIDPDCNDKPKKLSRKVNAVLTLKLIERYENKKMHGYFERVVLKDERIDKELSHRKTNNKNTTSHFAGYLDAIIDQEIPTKYLQHKRQIDNGITPTITNRCRLCKTSVEDVNHIISSCPMMSSRYYLQVRHDALAKYILKIIIQKNHPNFKYNESRETEYVKKVDNYEYWWNLPIKTLTKIPHNKPDLLVWNNNDKTCTILEFSCPSDINISNKVNDKLNIYGPLVRNMQIMYPEYKFQMVPIIVGALGYVPKSLKEYIEELGFSKNETKRHINKMQAIVTGGTIKICKTFLNFKL